MKSSRRRRRRHGFTLMEVLLVLAILVILGSLVGVSIFTMQRNANVRAAKTQISYLESCIATYQIDVGSLPPNLEALLAEPPELAGKAKWSGPYISKSQLPVDPWGQPYIYEPAQTATGFVIKSNGLDQQPGTPDDLQST